MNTYPNIFNSRYLPVASLFFLFCFLLFSITANAAPKQPMTLKGNFSLIDENGKAVTLEDYRGQHLLIYFGYTYCPDVCPTSLGIISQVLEGMSKKSLAKILPIFITVDPERDTTEFIKEYTDAFHPRMVGLTGSLKEARRAARTFGVYYAKAEVSEDDPEDYLVDHSSNTFFLDDQGRLLEIFGHAPDVDRVIATLEEALNQ